MRPARPHKNYCSLIPHSCSDFPSQESAFFFSEAATALQWGWLSDRFGRRPILLLGPLGLTFAMLRFGYSTSFWPMVWSRCMQGIFNGNIGAYLARQARTRHSKFYRCFKNCPSGGWCVQVKSDRTKLDLVVQLTDSSNIGDAFAMIPLMWSVGSTIAYVSSLFPLVLVNSRPSFIARLLAAC
jgi:MFS family permease